MCRVSIVLVAYNRPEGLKKSIIDVLNQSFQDFELLICDDNSPNKDVEEISKTYEQNDKRIKYYKQKQNLRMPGNANFGMKIAKGEYVVILHDGDSFHKDLLKTWVAGLDENPTAGFCFGAIGYLDRNDEIVGKDVHFSTSRLVSGKFILQKKYFRSPLMSSIVWGEAMVRKSILEEINYFDAKYVFWADVDTWMTILHTYDAFYTSEPLIFMPTKDILPNLFEINLVDNFFMFMEMFWRHRVIEFSKSPFKFYIETVIFYSYIFYGYCRISLLTMKHGSFRDYTYLLRTTIKNRKFYFIPFSICLLPFKIIFYATRHYTKSLR